MREQGPDEELPQSLENLVQQAIIDSGIARAGAEDLKQGARPSYLHLDGAGFGVSDRLVPSAGMPLRVRIDRVDAWWAAELREEPAE